jgi:hypothetical protein
VELGGVLTKSEYPMSYTRDPRAGQGGMRGMRAWIMVRMGGTRGGVGFSEG